MGVALATIRVLVIDDNEFIRNMVAAMLRDIGFEQITQANDGADALARLDAVDPGLIICDVAMAPMDGLAFAEALRKSSWRGAAEVPLIFLTAHTEAQIVKQAIKLGVKGYVVKPVQKKQLEARIMAALEDTLVPKQ